MTPKDDVIDEPGMELEPLPERSQGLVGQLGIAFSSPDEVALRIAEKLATSKTAEELFGDMSQMSWGDIKDQPVMVKWVDWLRSNLADGLGFFAVVTVDNLQDGEEQQVTTGATNVCIQLAKAVQEGWLDKPVILREFTTGSGYKAQRLEFVDAQK